MLEAVEVSKKYWDRSSGRQYDVLQSCSLQIAAGEAVGMMGPSGCGKSTLARVLLRLLPTDSGRIIFQTQDVTQLSQKQLKPFRQQVQFISQRPESFFDPLLKLGASLREPLQIFDLPDSSETIEAALATVKLSPALLDRYPHQVSGGEVQRLSIARALLLKPKLLILDEPTSMLDISVQAQILQLLKNIRQQEQMAFLFISHDKAVINYVRPPAIYAGRQDHLTKKHPTLCVGCFTLIRTSVPLLLPLQPLSQYFLQPFDTDRLAQMLVHPGIERHLDI